MNRTQYYNAIRQTCIEQAKKMQAKYQFDTVAELSKKFGAEHNMSDGYLRKMLRQCGRTNEVMNVGSDDIKPTKFNPRSSGFSQNIAHTRAYLG
jgi:hypothetical protein